MLESKTRPPPATLTNYDSAIARHTGVHITTIL